MAIQVVWDNDEKTIIRMDFDDWQWTDLHAALEALLTLGKSSNEPLGVIVNLEKANVMPLEGALTNLQHALSVVEPRAVLVSVKPIGKAIFDILTKLNPAHRDKVLYAETVDEARALLAKIADQRD
jgi:hypothetical protein